MYIIIYQYDNSIQHVFLLVVSCHMFVGQNFIFPSHALYHTILEIVNKVMVR